MSLCLFQPEKETKFDISFLYIFFSQLEKRKEWLTHYMGNCIQIERCGNNENRFCLPIQFPCMFFQNRKEKLYLLSSSESIISSFSVFQTRILNKFKSNFFFFIETILYLLELTYAY